MAYIETLIRTLERSQSDRPVLRFRDADISAAELLNLIASSVTWLSERGIARGHLVGLLAPNTPEALAARYATHLLGAASCFLSSPRDVKVRDELIRDIAPDLLLAFPETAHLVPAHVSCLSVVHSGGAPHPVRACLEPLHSLARDKDLAVVISSGGSTGVPKGSCRDFRSYTYAVSAVSGIERRQLVNGPLAYLSQILVDVTLLNGGYVVLRDRFDAADTLSQIEQQKITDLFLVEPQLFELMDHSDVPSTDLSPLRRLVHIGGSAPAALRKRASAKLGKCLMHTYGASEMGVVSGLSPEQYIHAFASSGHLMSDVAIRFRGEDGNLTDRWTPGVIEVNAPGMAQGYRNRPDLTRKAFDGGWYQSGDLGYLDEDGRLQIMGRASEIERVEGKWVTPTAMEDALCEQPSVRYAVVLADLAQKRRVAALELNGGCSLDVRKYNSVLEQMFSDETANSVQFIAYERIPRTEQGKPDRARIWSDADGNASLQAVAGEEPKGNQ
jgi:acyl-coenzyme A synthetase/AMP-(fatty) acid ligase